MRTVLALGALCALALPAAAQDLVTRSARQPGNWLFGTVEGYSTGFEVDEGYVLAPLAPDADPINNQPGGEAWYENWIRGFEGASVVVTDEQAHSGAMAIKFTFTGQGEVSEAQHIGVLDADPCDPVTGEWRPLIWEVSYSVFVPNQVPDGKRALRLEPWNNWTRLCDPHNGEWEGWSYQLILRRVDNGLTNGWYPQIGWAPMDNDLRDEMGMDPVEDTFATDMWWNVTIVADGRTGTVTLVRISDDNQNVFLADNLTDCFSSWGENCPGEGDPPGDNFCSRPERLSFFGYRDVLLDDVSVGVPGDNPCDMNCDGEISAFDIEPFLGLLFDPNAEPCAPGTGDVNGDGTVDAFDIEPFLECLFP